MGAVDDGTVEEEAEMGVRWKGSRFGRWTLHRYAWRELSGACVHRSEGSGKRNARGR